MKRLLMLMLLGLLLAGCGPLGQPSAEEIVRRAERAMNEMEQAHAVIEVEGTANDQSVRAVSEGWIAGKQGRAVVLEASEAAAVGTLAVSDGEQGWLYHPDSNVVLTGSLQELKSYQEEQADGVMLDPAVDFAGLTASVDELLRITDQKLLGSDTIAGLEAWHLSLTPNAEAPPAVAAAGGTVELWISKAHDLPLQVIYRGGAMGEGRVTVRQYEATFEVDSDFFAFAPPAGAEVVDVATRLPEQMTLAEARAAAPFALLSTPADRAEATLIEVYRLGDAYVQRFDGTLGEWSLTQSASLPEHAAAPDSRPADGKAEARFVKVRGVEGRLIQDAQRGRTMLVWQEGGSYLALSGQLSAATALELAESLQ